MLVSKYRFITLDWKRLLVYNRFVVLATYSAVLPSCHLDLLWFKKHALCIQFLYLHSESFNGKSKQLIFKHICSSWNYGKERSKLTANMIAASKINWPASIQQNVEKLKIGKQQIPALLSLRNQSLMLCTIFIDIFP